MRTQTKEWMMGESREAYLRRLVDASGKTIKQIALDAGIPVSTLSTILKRGIGGASLDIVLKICTALELDVDSLARGVQTGMDADALRTVKAAERLMTARYALRYRAAALAAMLDIPLSHYMWFESANYHVPMRYLEKLAEIMDVSLDYLTGKADKDEAVFATVGDESFYNLPAPDEYEECDMGEAIRRKRLKDGLSLEDAAEKMRTTADLLNQWEARVRVPTRDKLLDICNGLGMEYNALFSIPANPDEDIPLTKEEGDMLHAYRKADQRDRDAVGVILGRYASL
ncbi:helix-turn-helix domain-containing protein [Eubacteriales bacterium OttesenSCG-928-K08]|nr:helix-turn-helix domain-containing protein [Eubacteriales bacterium OttesenSCG-928-K08]